MPSVSYPHRQRKCLKICVYKHPSWALSKPRPMEDLHAATISLARRVSGKIVDEKDRSSEVIRQKPSEYKQI